MTANADRGLRPERVAEIIVALPGAAVGRRGSGYLVSPGKVLTAAHVVEGVTGVRVRFQVDRPGERTVEASVAWRHEGIDIAVLTLPALADEDTDVAPVPYGRAGEHDAVLRCTALGFPRFKLRTDDDGSRFRDAEHVHAACAVLSNRREGTLDLCVTSPPADDRDPERDAWEGMSGAAVFAGGRLIGVVSRHHRSDGPGRIAASRVDRWAEKVSAAELAALEHELGRSLGPASLLDAVPATGHDVIQKIYRAQLADIAPEELTDRQSELQDLVEFCGGSTEYLWLQGPPWAGKTALAAWFALHPPRGIVPVWFFITARYAGQSDGDAYTGAVIDQLAALAGREPTRHYASPTARDGERRLLLREAAERVARDGATLLLVVDGLDEDQSLQPGGSTTSIASLLPERLPPNVRVLVTSRPSPGIPPDVKGSHPLRHCPVEQLTTSAAARHTEHEARYELQRALTGDQLERDVVGLLTAARGTLTVDDLRELTGESGYTLRHRLGSVFGRILRLRGGDFSHSAGGDVTLYTTSRGYLFAHEILLAAAQEELGRDVDAYRVRLHAWATTYERQGWPEDTPLYLLQPYGRLVALLRDTSRATSLATDARRRDRLREVTGSDAACLAEIAAARETVRRVVPEDMGALAVLAVVEDMVARRNASLHPDIPAVYARLGRVRQAIGLARSVYRPMDRARAVAGVAHVLTESGDRRAVGLAEEAVRLAEGVPRRGMPYREANIMAARGTLAIALVRAGRPDEAVRGLRELPRPHNDSPAVKAYGNALIKTAETLGDAENAAALLRKAEETTGWFGSALDRACGLAHVAKAYSTRGLAEDAVRLYESARELARGQGEGSENLSGIAEDALRDSFPDEAKALASRAAEALDLDRRPVHGEATHSAVMALVAMERMAAAHRHAQTVGGGDRLSVEDWPSDIWSLIVEGAARRGAVAEAWAALEAWSILALPDDHRPTARVVDLLTGAGAATEVEALLLDMADAARVSVPQENRVEEALAALAGHFAADDPQRSLALLHKAEHGPTSAAGPDSLFASERLAAFAGALATANRPGEAEQLLGTIDEPHVRAWGCAAVSLALAGRDTDQALTFAVHAVELCRTIEDTDLFPEPLMAAVQALGWAGAARRVTDVFAEFTQRVAGRLPFDGDLALTETTAGLWQHDPGLAGRLADDVLLRMPGHAVARAARLLVAVKPHDEERAARIERLSLDTRAEQPLRRNFGYGDEILLSLLIAADDPVAAKAHLDEMVASPELSEGLFSRSMGGAALAYAALGDDETARSIARRADNEERSAETFTQLAAYAACLPADRVPVPIANYFLDIALLARRLATLLLPPPSGPDLPRARALLTEALTPAGWHHALPVLAAIDPDAVHRVRDVVFAHLGLSD
ncbi:trypsin-like peptidase domain-containing protein [Streptomyces sp. NBC_00487]|uniref:trypsin-like peptidase domain-containing protein n=1 Tax=unclassified Streptomyces TaxID=2593676 RepID=UPI002E18A233|nr:MULTISPECIES: trypsin-like peptidase domain-containing protein [unclassified Streptomyces]